MVNKNKVQFLEVGRGLAAVLVVLDHASTHAFDFYSHHPFSKLFFFGYAAVNFFFVLSGFIIFHVHSDHIGRKEYLGPFLTKRIIRIYPAYLVISLGLIAGYILFPNMSADGFDLSPPKVIFGLLLIPYVDQPPLNVAWTLIHEMFFYVLFSVLIIKKNLGWVIMCLWGVAILFSHVQNLELGFPFDFIFSIQNIGFLLGILVAKICQKVQKNYNYYFYFGCFVFFGVGIGEMVGPIFVRLENTLLYSLASAMIIFGAYSLHRFSKIKIHSLLLLVGSASYSIYLIHNPVLSILHRVVQWTGAAQIMHPDIVFLIICSLCVLSGILFFMIFERPALNFIRGYFKKNFLWSNSPSKSLP